MSQAGMSSSDPLPDHVDESLDEEEKGSIHDSLVRNYSCSCYVMLVYALCVLYIYVWSVIIVCCNWYSCLLVFLDDFFSMMLMCMTCVWSVYTIFYAYLLPVVIFHVVIFRRSCLYNAHVYALCTVYIYIYICSFKLMFSYSMSSIHIYAFLILMFFCCHLYWKILIYFAMFYCMQNV